MKIQQIFKILFYLLPIFIVAQENSSILCGDGIDNDGDGDVDCEDVQCQNLPNQGCSICPDGTSFADILIEYFPTCPDIDPDPSGAIGVSDWPGPPGMPEYVFLGEGGFIKLGFTNNILTNSGNNSEDIWVFEIGAVVESIRLAIKPVDAFTTNQLILLGIPDVNNDGYFEIGSIGGALSGFDLDGIMPGYLAGELKFDAIEIMDVQDANCQSGTPGADIDAVCALSSIPPEVDCNGTPNGTAVIDDCGNCLEVTDPTFNGCNDCNGIPNGTAVIDDCGNCLEVTDPTFNDCYDCNGIINGTAILDDCGLCLELNAPSFNESCEANYYLFIPNAFSPDNNGINDEFRILENNGFVKQIQNYMIFNRWGNKVYEAQNFDISTDTYWWDGTYKNKLQPIGVYLYIINVEFANDEIKKYQGNITLIR